MYTKITEDLKDLIVPGKKVILQRFFKTGPGEYGEGDTFIGVTMPNIRKVSKRYTRESTLEDIEQLLRSGVHEYRMTALILLVNKFEKTVDKNEKENYVSYYLDHVKYIDNWDLVDVTCYKILGPWLYTRDRTVLYELAKTDHLWSQRIAMITTMFFIREHDYTDTLRLSDILLEHPHDLIHKAVGWMLREVGNRDPKTERSFLATRYERMPRTMLRYAIEKFPETERRAYLHGKI